MNEVNTRIRYELASVKPTWQNPTDPTDIGGASRRFAKRKT
jgi:hypothetical protein